MKTLSEYRAALEKSKKPSDQAVAGFLRENERKILLWLFDYMNGAQTRGDLLQETLLAVCEEYQNPDGEEALRNVRNAMQRFARRGKNWEKRRVPSERLKPRIRNYFGLETT